MARPFFVKPWDSIHPIRMRYNEFLLAFPVLWFQNEVYTHLLKRLMGKKYICISIHFRMWERWLEKIGSMLFRMIKMFWWLRFYIFQLSCEKDTVVKMALRQRILLFLFFNTNTFCFVHDNIICCFSVC